MKLNSIMNFNYDKNLVVLHLMQSSVSDEYKLHPEDIVSFVNKNLVIIAFNLKINQHIFQCSVHI